MQSIEAKQAPRLRAGRLWTALILDFVLLATFYNVSIPVFEMPDEHGHFFFAQYLAKTGELPVQVEDVDERGPWEQEGSQPPLYYYLTAPTIAFAKADLEEEELWINPQNSMGTPAIIGNENRFVHPPEQESWPWKGYALAVHLGRFISTLLGTLTLYCIWRITRRILPGRRPLALATAAIVGLNPQFLAVHASFSNDPAIIALSALVLMLIIDIADGRREEHSIALLAVAAGLAPLAKLSGLALVAFAGASLTGLAWKRRDLQFLIRSLLPLVLTTALLSGWWYLRNIQLYGSLTGLNYMLPGQMGRSWRLDRWLQTEAWGELKGIWYSSWGLFGWFTILMPKWVYGLITTLSALAGIGIIRAWREHRAFSQEKKEILAARAALQVATEKEKAQIESSLNQASGTKLDRIRKAYRISSDVEWMHLGWIGLWAGLVATSLLRWLTISKGGQGRLLFPAVAFLGLVLIIGWRSLFASWLEKIPKRLAELPGLADPEARAIWAADRGDARLSTFVMLMMYVFSAATLIFVIRPAYAWPESIEGDDIPATAHRADVVFGEEMPIKLHAVEFPERVKSGEKIPVTLYWERLEVENQPPLSRFDRGGHKNEDDREWPIREGLIGLDTETTRIDFDEIMHTPSKTLLSYLGNGNTPFDLLTPGKIIVDQHWVETPGGDFGTPVGLNLNVNIYDPERDNHWPIQDQDGTSWDGWMVLDPLDTNELQPPEEPPLATFENGLRLWLGTNHMLPIENGVVSYPSSRAGWGSETNLLWYVSDAPTESLQVFVHLIDTEGERETFDQLLQTEFLYQFRDWNVGEQHQTVLHWNPSFRLLLQPDAAKLSKEELELRSNYELEIGLYRLEDGTRIPVYDADGSRFKDDAIPLHKIKLVDIHTAEEKAKSSSSSQDPDETSDSDE